MIGEKKEGKRKKICKGKKFSGKKVGECARHKTKVPVLKGGFWGEKIQAQAPSSYKSILAGKSAKAG